MRKTTVRDARGRIIGTSTTRRSYGCATQGQLWAVLVLFVVLAPLGFGVAGAILAYAFLALVAWLVIWALRRKAAGKRP
jgi:hypothetical protein